MRESLAGQHREGCLKGLDGVVNAVGLLSMHALQINGAKHALCQRPVLRAGLARPHREGRAEVRDGLLHIVGSIASDALRIGKAQIVLGGGPLAP